MSVTVFVVRVPAAESLVGDWRTRFDASAPMGVPAHITILFPFMPPDDITADILPQADNAFCRMPAFDFSLSRVTRFAHQTIWRSEFAAQMGCSTLIRISLKILESRPRSFSAS